MRFWLLAIFLVVFAAACVSQSIEDFIKINADVFGFKSLHPNATVRIELVNNITAPSLYEEILSGCPDVVKKPRYWKVSLSDSVSNSSTTVWVNDIGSTVCKITAEGKIEVVVKNSDLVSTSTMSPGPKAKGDKCSADSECSTTFCSAGYCADDTPGRFSSGVNGGGGSGGSGGTPSAPGTPSVPGQTPITVPILSSGPNLVPGIDEIFYDASVLRIKYSLRNIGDKPATNASMLMAIAEHGMLSNCTYITPLLEVGSTQRTFCYLYPSQGYVLGHKYAAGAVADPDWLIPETNEIDNNVTNENIDTSLPVQSQTTTSSTTTTAGGTTTTTAAGLKAKGQSCSSNSECSSNFCFSGFCADQPNTSSTTTTSTSTTTTSTTTTTTTTQPSTVDFTSSIQAPSISGRSASASWSVSNTGAGNSGTSKIDVGFYQAPNPNPIDSCTSNTALNAGSMVSGTCTKTMPSAGTYTVRVFADSDMQIAETNENNNIDSKDFNVS
ncbi:MAG: hypothetical protein HY362_03440 [Candidatus Aenigmarchaeota archaeon]|nr:hypothetical protein [Candidatus Aenigmarchaeota archaeon]